MTSKLLARLLRHSVVRNAFALYVTQAAGLLLPLVTLPYLSRVLGPQGWGRVLVAQSFAIWASLPIEYGFSLSASRRVARHRDDLDRLADIVASVWGARFVLLLPLSLGALAIATQIPLFRDHHALLAWAMVHAWAMGFSPFWYFQGMERMAPAVSLEVLGRALVTGGIFLIVKNPEDGWKVVALQAIVGICSSAVPVFWIYRKVRWQAPRWHLSIEALRDGLGVFIFRAASSINTSANALILGLLAFPAAVGYYGGGERLVSALLMITGPLSQALYPHMSHLIVRDRGRAASVATLSMAIIGGMAIATGIVAVIAAPWLVHLVLGPGYAPSVLVLRVLALLLPLRAATNVFGMQWLLPSGKERVVSRVVILAGLINVLLAILLAPRWQQDGMAWAVVFSETVAVVALWVAAKKCGLMATPSGATETLGPTS